MSIIFTDEIKEEDWDVFHFFGSIVYMHKKDSRIFKHIEYGEEKIIFYPDFENKRDGNE